MDVRPCLWFLQNNGYCPYGTQCKFRHDFKAITCRFFMRGRCEFGSECRYFHPNLAKRNSAKNRDPPESAKNLEPAEFVKNPEPAEFVKNSVPAESVKNSEPAESVENSEPAESVKNSVPAESVENSAKTSEISYLKRRFPGKLKENGENLFIMEFEPSDPDWPFDVRKLQLRIEIVEKFPEFPPKITVIPDGMMPEKLVGCMNSAFVDRLKAENGTKTGIFRAFFGWLDRHLQQLFVDGLKKVKLEMQAKAAGISLTLPPKNPPINENEAKDVRSPEKNDENAAEIFKTDEENFENEPEFSSSSSTANPKFAPDAPKGTAIEFRDFELGDHVGTVSGRKLSLLLQCGRCATKIEAVGQPGQKISGVCSKCHVIWVATFHSTLLHAQSGLLGHLETNHCALFDLILQNSDLAVNCIECGTDTLLKGCVLGQLQTIWCRQCHAKLVIKLDSLKFTKPLGQSFQGPTKEPEQKVRTQKPPKDPAIQEGKPLPANGTCKHYKKSYRWFRFPCCGKAYPCDVCHEENEAHEIVFANRIICGFCGKEQPFAGEKPCISCGGNVTKVTTPHWEGGQGCRDPVKMARGDRRKYKITAKQQQQRQKAQKQKKES